MQLFDPVIYVHFTFPEFNKLLQIAAFAVSVAPVGV